MKRFVFVLLKFLGILILATPLIFSIEKFRQEMDMFYVGLAVVIAVTQLFLFKSIIADFREE